MISKINKIWYDRKYKEYYNLKEKVDNDIFYITSGAARATFAAGAAARAVLAGVVAAADKPKAALKEIMNWFALRLNNI